MRRPLSRPFAQVDVFTSVPYRGNPLAVVCDAEGLDTEEMQRFAAWTNLSETTFLLAPTSGNADQTSQADQLAGADQTSQADQLAGADQTSAADYRVRIFTPDRELPFAGHPTLGTCRVWLDQGGVPHRPDVIVQECGAGLVTIRLGDGADNNAGDSPGNGPGNRPRNSAGDSPGIGPGNRPDNSAGDSPGNGPDSSRLAFAAPPLVRSGPVSTEDLAAACALVGIDPDSPDTPVVDASWVANGPPWMGVLLRSAEEVLALQPQAANPQDLFVGVVGPHLTGSAANDCDFEVRALFPKHGALTEDPVTGSLNASLGQWLTAAGHATAPYVASQGAALGRDGRVYIDQDPDGTIWVGGEVVTCIQGTVEI